jgi:hypothetical protein
MPTFPVYPGELPTCLNPLNLRHYFLLAYWVFYRPTALKCYLYQIDPDLYRTEGGIGNFLKTFRYPAYLHLYLLVAPTALLFAFSISGLLLYGIFGESAKWSNLLNGIIATSIGTSIGVSIGISICIFRGVTNGVARGVTNGVSICVAGGVAIGVLLCISIRMGVGIFCSAAFGLIFGVTVRVVFGASFGIAFGVASGMISGIAISIVIGIAFCIHSIAISISKDLLVDIIDVSNGLAIGANHSLAICGGIFVGLLGLFTYIPPFLLSLFWKENPRYTILDGQHPMMCNELHILPLPSISKAIDIILENSCTNSFIQIASVVSNPFHYASLQVSLRRYLLNHSNPIHYLYYLLYQPNLANYVFAPVLRSQWQDIPSVRELFLGEIFGDRVKVFDNDWYVYKITKYKRHLEHTPISDLAGLLYDLLQADKAEFTGFDFQKYTDMYLNLSNYPGGAEIATSYTLFASSLNCRTITDISLSQINCPFPLPEPSTAIRPGIITTQQQFQSIAENIQSALTMTSRVNQLAAYARANDDLQDLEEYITENTLKPEQTILLLIIEHWTEIITPVSGSIARTEITATVANPYVAGNPVTGDIFVGRTDILRRIEELWMAEKPPSLVIYGHRRMGKSSILLNLQGKLNKDTILIDFNMQRVGLVDNTAELLHNLAVRFYDALEPSVRATWAEPEFTAFSSGNVYSVFDRFLTQLDRYRNGKRFAIAIDEFELIETQINQGILEPRLLSYFLGILETYPWVFFAFAGLHTLEEMTRNYWEPLFAKVARISVSFLEPATARQLIIQPTPDFNLDYGEDAIDLIVEYTAGQPYLIQLICLNLVSQFNYRNLIPNHSFVIDKKFRFSATDVEAVLNNNEFEINGSAYFRAIWDRADSNQQLILQHLVGEDLSLPELLAKIQLTPEQIQPSLDNLKYHDVLSQQQDKYTYCVPLMRRWVAKYKSID